MSDDKQLVSIGLPAFNGGDFIARTVACLLDQDYENLELIISDNASTDDAESVCRSLAEREPRNRYFRQLENKGMGWNWWFVNQQPTGYRIWAVSEGEDEAQ